MGPKGAEEADRSGWTFFSDQLPLPVPFSFRPLSGPTISSSVGIFRLPMDDRREGEEEKPQNDGKRRRIGEKNGMKKGKKEGSEWIGDFNGNEKDSGRPKFQMIQTVIS